jgi:hypothetical protein
MSTTTGSGPGTPISISPATPTPSPAPTAEDPALNRPDPSTAAREATVDDENVLIAIESGAGQLLSTAFPDGLSDPFSSAQNGWITASPAGDPYGGAAAADGSLYAFVGQNVDFYTGVAPAGNNSNGYTGDQNVEPFTGNSPTDLLTWFEKFEDQWSTGGGATLDTSQMQATAAPVNSGNAGLDKTIDEVLDRYSGSASDAPSPFNNGAGQVLTEIPWFSSSPQIAVSVTVVPETAAGAPPVAQTSQGIAGVPADTSPTASPSPAPLNLATLSSIVASTWMSMFFNSQDSTPAPLNASQPPPLSPPPDLGTISAQEDEEDWKAGRAGMWNSLVDLGAGLLNSLWAPVNTYGLRASLDWAKAEPPAPTGDPARDKRLQNSYWRGGLVTTVASVAAPLGTEGLLESASAALTKLPGLVGAGIGGGKWIGPTEQWLSSFNKTAESLGAELKNSLPTFEDIPGAVGDKPPQHHIFPQAFRSFFQQAGIDIDRWALNIPRSLHDFLHQRNPVLADTGEVLEGIGPGGIWNENWRQFFADPQFATTPPTAEQIWEQAFKMVVGFDLSEYLPTVQYLMKGW